MIPNYLFISISKPSPKGRPHCLMRSSRGRHSSIGQPSAPPSGSFRPTLAAGSRFWARRSNALRNGRSGANEGPSRAKHPTRAYASTWRRACAGCSSGHIKESVRARDTSHGSLAFGYGSGEASDFKMAECPHPPPPRRYGAGFICRLVFAVFTWQAARGPSARAVGRPCMRRARAARAPG